MKIEKNFHKFNISVSKLHSVRGASTECLLIFFVFINKVVLDKLQLGPSAASVGAVGEATHQ